MNEQNPEQRLLEQRLFEQRLLELLADQAVFGLDDEESEELRQLINQSGMPEDASFELAASLVEMSNLAPAADQTASQVSGSLPSDLRKKIAETARKELGIVPDPAVDSKHSTVESRISSSPESGTDQGVAATHPQIAQRETPVGTPASRIREVVAWAMVAAVGFVALSVWNHYRSQAASLDSRVAELNTDLKELEEQNQILVRKQKALESRNQQLLANNLDLQKTNDSLNKENRVLASERNQLQTAVNQLKKKLNPDPKEIYQQLAGRDDVINWKWASTGETNAGGEILFDEKNQTGVMRLVDLDVNDPEVSQYQLWIIEESGRKHPVDGGVFDIREKGEVFVPVSPKLLTRKAATFAVTVEKPGGVVVSGQEKVPLIAKAPTSQPGSTPQGQKKKENAKK